MTRRLLIPLFLAGLFLPLVVSVLVPPPRLSVLERRLLHPVPARPRTLADLTTWPRRFEACYGDRFGLRNTWALLHNLLKYRLFHDATSDQVLLGKDGWLFLRGSIHGSPVDDWRHINLYTSEQLGAFMRGLRLKQDWLARQAIAYLLVIPPNKHSIYPEHLPDYLHPLAPRSALDQLMAARPAELHLLDLRPVLLRAKGDGRPLYHLTDTHWNAYGANIAQYQILKVLSGLLSHPVHGVQLYPPARFRWRERDGGDLATLMGLPRILRETAPLFTPAPCAANPRKLAEDPLILETRCPGKGPRLLVFHDSFTDALQPYLSAVASTAIYVNHAAFAPFPSQLVNRFRPDAVIEEWVERVLPVTPPVAREWRP